MVSLRGPSSGVTVGGDAGAVGEGERDEEEDVLLIDVEAHKSQRSAPPPGVPRLNMPTVLLRADKAVISGDDAVPTYRDRQRQRQRETDRRQREKRKAVLNGEVAVPTHSCMDTRARESSLRGCRTVPTHS